MRLLLLLLVLLFVSLIDVSAVCLSSVPSCDVTLAQDPTAWFNLTFSHNTTNSNYVSWEDTDPNDSTCSYSPQGLLSFPGGSNSSGTFPNYIDLNVATGANSVELLYLVSLEVSQLGICRFNMTVALIIYIFQSNIIWCKTYEADRLNSHISWSQTQSNLVMND